MTVTPGAAVGQAKTGPDAMSAADLLLDVRNLRTQFKTMDGMVRAVDGVDFSLRAGRSLGIVGESGSGKSVTADGHAPAGVECAGRGRGVVQRA
jgi:ABC-type dipeptide/oligopeptide/nickel transport system ATPase subunit